MDGLKARLSFDAVAYDYDDEYLTIDTDTHTINMGIRILWLNLHRKSLSFA